MLLTQNINDFHLFTAQKLNYDIIVYGYVYTKQDAIITGYTHYRHLCYSFLPDENGIENMYMIEKEDGV